MENLRTARIEAGHTQKSLATLLNISQQCYSDYENERTEPDLATLSKIADLLKTSVDYLLGRSDDLGYVTVQSSTPALSPEEKKLIEDYRGLGRPLKDLLQEMIRTWQSSDSESKKPKLQGRK